MSRLLALAAPAAVLLGSCAMQPPTPSADTMQRVIDEAYTSASPAHKARSVQDASQQLCSRPADTPLDGADAGKVVAAARASIKYPADGKLAGDWRQGEKLAQNGAGLRLLPAGGDNPKNPNGANCYACHKLDPKEENAGNLGTSLTGFGKARGHTPETVKYAYEKIYNAWAFFPCSNMPRMGASGYLTPEQIAHVVAYLVDPASPVNR